MSDGHFFMEGDLLKHHIRTHEWLPACRRRLDRIRTQTSNPKHPRRLKYFTFCAVGAIDVLMLDVAKVVRRSSKGRFDTVVFFDRTNEDVDQTKKRIPGAIGFPGDFIEVVLEPESPVGDQLGPDQPADTFTNRARARLLNTKQQFITQFPFDVINLDLEEFLFKPTQPIPGDVVNAMRKLFEWQKRHFIPVGSRKATTLSEFSLMFTTQIGPPEMTDEYINLLEERVQNNITTNPNLLEILNIRTGFREIHHIRDNSFGEFFKIGVPKVISSILMEEDWYIDPNLGVRIYEIERQSSVGPYRMLHLGMDVKRHNPPREERAPGNESGEASEAYLQVTERIFQDEVIQVTEDIIDETSLNDSLENIFGRRRKYFPEGEEE